jgi:O-antigen/teichoic acid export membrane protein
MRQLVRSLLILSPLTAITLAASLVQGKALAVILGPEGNGRFFLAASFFSLATMLGAIGIHSALTKLVSEFRGSSQPELVWEAVLLALASVTATSLLLIGVAALWSDELGTLLLGGLEPEADREFIVLISAIALVPAGWSLAMLGFLRGLGVVRAYSLTASVSAVLTVFAVVGGAWSGGFKGAFVGAVIGQSLGAIIMGFSAARQATAADIKFSLAVRHAPVLQRRILAFGLLTLVAGLAGGIGHNLTRSFLAASIDFRAVGFFAAAWSITNRLPTLLYQTFSAHLMPTISSLNRDWQKISVEQNNALRLALIAGTPVLCITVVAAPLVVRLLLSSEFLPMSDLLRVMLFGELLSLVYWATGMALYPSGRPLANAICEWAWWVLFGFLLLGLTNASGLIGAGYAYVLSYGVLATALYGVEARVGRLRWSAENLRLLMISVTTLLTMTVVSTRVVDSPVLLSIMLSAVLVAWPSISLTSHERMVLRNAVLRRLKIAPTPP